MNTFEFIQCSKNDVRVSSMSNLVNLVKALHVLVCSMFKKHVQFGTSCSTFEITTFNFSKVWNMSYWINFMVSVTKAKGHHCYYILLHTLTTKTTILCWKCIGIQISEVFSLCDFFALEIHLIKFSCFILKNSVLFHTLQIGKSIYFHKVM